MGANLKVSVTKEEVKSASEVNLLDYLMSIGEPLKADGNNFYRHQDHDSLVINPKKNYFSWNSRNVSGNAVTYLMNVYNLTFQNAVIKINKDLGNSKISKFEAPETVYPDTFAYDVKEVNNTDNIINYLVNDRKIDRDLIEAFINADLIKEDIYKNVVFKWKMGQELIGATLQGTREIPEEKRISQDRAYFKKVLPTTAEATFNGFNITRGYPKKLIYFEAPIDLLSYFSLNRSTLSNCRLISMDGLKHQTVFNTLKLAQNELKEVGSEVESITLGVDNDKAGIEFINKMESIELQHKSGKGIAIVSDIPQLPPGRDKWDWNNELKAKVENSFKKKLSSDLEL